MERVTVSVGVPDPAGRRGAAGGRPGPGSWDECHAARDEAGLTDIVLLGWSGMHPPRARGTAYSMVPATHERVKASGRCRNVTIGKRTGIDHSL